MIDDRKLKIAKSIRQHEVKSLVCRALFVFFVMELTLCAIFKLPTLNLGQSMVLGLKMMISFKSGDFEMKIGKSIYNHSNSRTDSYEIYGDIRVHTNSSTIFVPSSFQLLQNITNPNPNPTWTIRPYSRKFNSVTFVSVREWKIHIPPPGKFPNCTRHLDTPAVLFSTAALSTNHFHVFSDVLIPLFLTTRHLNRKVVFLITNYGSWWKAKYYKTIVDKLTKYEIIDIDREKDVLCFSKMIVGLKNNKEFSINGSESPHYSARDFTQFIRTTYSLKRDSISDCRNASSRPRLLIISRIKYRVLVNAGELAQMARELGFDVVVKDLGPNLSIIGPFVNSFDVMIGVHGAGLTNMLFLPEKAVVVQIVPFALEEISEGFFGISARDMNFRYLAYNASIGESTLINQYPLSSEVFRDPGAIEKKKGWLYFHLIYLRTQNVNIDLDKFRGTLLNALQLIGS